MTKPIITVNHLSSSDPRNMERVTLLVTYGAKEARIEIPIGAPLFDREPGAEIYRRDLHGLLEALREWEDSHEEIQWPRHG